MSEVTTSLTAVTDKSLASHLTISQRAVLEYLNGFKVTTRRTMKTNLLTIIDLIQPNKDRVKRRQQGEMDADLMAFDWTRLDRTMVKTVLRRAQDAHLSGSTIHSLLIVCRGMADELWELGVLNADETKGISRVGRHMKGKGIRVKKSKSISDDDFIAMLGVCAKDRNPRRGMRDMTMLALAIGSGCRASEIIGLEMSKIDFEKGKVTVRGKGDNDREVFVVDGVMTALKRWLEVYTPVNGILFPAWLAHVDKAIPGRAGLPMSYNSFYEIVRQRALQAGVEVPTPHWFRHGFAARTYLATGDLFSVQLQLGHSDDRTTRLYISDLVEGEAKRKAAASWKLPEVK